MELVYGTPLTEYCDQNQLTTRERLELFVQVCHAVEHAHQKGIIHRDLKPSHVMVTLYDGVPVPKIIDFGIAKATSGQLTEKTALTGYGQMIGTPLYMSPEQAELSGLDVDTRSDIYSLGVVLYELLTGSTPFDQERVREAGYDEIRRMIREDDPPRPSARISTLGEAATTVSAHRKTDPAKLSGLLRRDLDWIVMKALQKDRTRRYQTASDFARDIQRYLNDEPIEARPPTLFDRAAKWARRHRPLLWAAAASVVAVVALLVATTMVALSQSEIAGRRLRVQQGISDALAEVARLRGQTPAGALGDQAALAQAREQLQRAVALAESGPAAPEVVAQVQGLLSELDQEQRDRQLLTALDNAWLARANSPIWTGDAFVFKNSTSILNEALTAYGLDYKRPPEQAAATIRARPEAVRLGLLAALDELRASTGAGGLPGVLWRGSSIGDTIGGTYVHWVTSGSVAGRDGRLKPGDRLVGIGQGRDGAIVDTRRATLPRIAKLFHRVRGTIMRLEVTPPGGTESRIYEFQIPQEPHVAWLDALVDAADTDPWRRRAREAYELADEAKQRAALQKLADDADVERQSVRVLTRLADELAELEAVDRAIGLLRKVRGRHPSDLVANMSLAKTLAKGSTPARLEEAVRYYTAAVALRPDSPGLRNDLGNAFFRQGNLEEAIAEYREVIRLMPYRSEPHRNLGEALRRQGKLDEAVAACRDAVRLLPLDADFRFALGVALRNQGKLEEAVAEYREAIRLEPDFQGAYNSLAWLLATSPDPKWRQPAQAVELAKKVVALAPKEGGFWNTLGVAQYRAGDHKAAIEALGKSIELSSGGNAFDWFFLAMAHWQLGHKDEARTWYDKAVQWMEKNKPKDDELLRFRAEAAQLLGIPEKPPAGKENERPEKPKAESGKPKADT